MAEYQDISGIPSSLCAPPFPSALSSTVQDSVSHLTQDDFQRLHDLLIEQRHEISAKIGIVRDTMAHLSHAKAKVDKALQEMINISKQRKRKNKESLLDNKQHRVSPYPVSRSSRPIRSVGHLVGQHLDIDVAMDNASVSSSRVPFPFPFPCDPSPTSNNGNTSFRQTPSSSSPATEPLPLPNTLQTPQPVTPLATEVHIPTSTDIVGAHSIPSQPAHQLLAIAPAYNNLNHQAADESLEPGYEAHGSQDVNHAVLGGELAPTTSLDTNHKPVIHLSALAKRWRNWKVAEIKGAPLQVDKTHYRVANNSDYERMDPIALFKKLVIKKKRPAVVEPVPEPDLDSSYGTRRAKKSSSRYDPMQKGARRKPTTSQVLGTEGRRVFDPNGIEVASLLESILLDEQLNNLTKYLGDLELQGPV